MPELRTFYPEIEPFATGRLTVPGGHELYYEESGNPKGKPVVFLHGGPGGGTEPKQRRFFDPKAYRIVLFDQRGCGKSTPHASLEQNTTWDLVADVERLREHLGIERWQVFGGSWGSTLGVAYAETHPARVTELILRGIFMFTDREAEWFYGRGTRILFPDAWDAFVAVIPPAERGDLIAAYYARLTGDDPQVRIEAARASAMGAIRGVATDKTSRIGSLWRWMTTDGLVPEIWLYSHHETQKWKCQFFRIWVTRSTPALHFHLQSYVPLGFEGDPGLGKYKLEASNVYTRPGWRRIDVVNTSYNRANTYSLNASEQQTSGVSFGVTAGVNVGTQRSQTEGTSTNESTSYNRSFNETISWFDNYGSNFNSSMQGSSSGISSGHGRSGGRSAGHGDSHQHGTGTNRAETVGFSEGASYSAAKTINDSLAHTIGYGFGLTEGKTLQVQEYNYGIDYSQKSADLLAQWRECSPDAGEIYNDVIASSTAVYADDPVPLSERRQWLEARRVLGYPVLVAADDGRVVKLFRSVPGGLTVYAQDRGAEGSGAIEGVQSLAGVGKPAGSASEPVTTPAESDVAAGCAG